ncbi:hypothetical protein V8F20_011444 [Naviculisporaceae sp. PSN 640]
MFLLTVVLVTGGLYAGTWFFLDISTGSLPLCWNCLTTWCCCCRLRLFLLGVVLQPLMSTTKNTWAPSRSTGSGLRDGNKSGGLDGDLSATPSIKQERNGFQMIAGAICGEKEMRRIWWRDRDRLLSPDNTQLAGQFEKKNIEYPPEKSFRFRWEKAETTEGRSGNVSPQMAHWGSRAMFCRRRLRGFGHDPTPVCLSQPAGSSSVVPIISPRLMPKQGWQASTESGIHYVQTTQHDMAFF